MNFDSSSVTSRNSPSSSIASTIDEQKSISTVMSLSSMVTITVGLRIICFMVFLSSRYVPLILHYGCIKSNLLSRQIYRNPNRVSKGCVKVSRGGVPKNHFLRSKQNHPHRPPASRFTRPLNPPPGAQVPNSYRSARVPTLQQRGGASVVKKVMRCMD